MPHIPNHDKTSQLLYNFVLTLLSCSIGPGDVFNPSSVVSDDTTREAVLLDGAVWPLPLLLRKVLPILHRGLEKRVKLLTILPENEAKVHSVWLTVMKKK